MRLRKEVDIERNKTTRILSERHAAQTINAEATNAPNPSATSLSVQDIKESQAYCDLLTARELQAIQLDKALQTIVHLRKDVDIERNKTTQALNERQAIQKDLDKFRAMQREAFTERSFPRHPVKPWYKFW